jgi:hypothetical protein
VSPNVIRLRGREETLSERLSRNLPFVSGKDLHTRTSSKMLPPPRHPPPPPGEDRDPGPRNPCHPASKDTQDCPPYSVQITCPVPQWPRRASGSALKVSWGQKQEAAGERHGGQVHCSGLPGTACSPTRESKRGRAQRAKSDVPTPPGENQVAKVNKLGDKTLP